MPFSRTCQGCGKTFTAKERRIKYCGKLCYYDRTRGEKHATAKQSRPKAADDSPTREDTVDGNHRHVEYRSTRQPRNEQELIEDSGVDQTQWRVKRFGSRAWQMGIKNAASELEAKTLWSVWADFERTHEYDATRALIDTLLADARKQSPKIKRIKAPSSGQCLEIGAFDVHVGMRAWPEETRGPAYDTDIAVADWDRALDTLLSRAGYWNPEQVVYILGGDICHIDSAKGETFAGTQMGDQDTRYPRVVRHINAALRRQVERLARDVAPVKVINVQGNHDRTTSLHIGEVLDAYFHHNKNVEVVNEASTKAYYTWGENLIGVFHGDVKGGKGKIKDLANVMTEDRPQDWARCRHRAWRIGHLHEDWVCQNHSVTIWRSPALCPPNAHAAHNSYVGSPRGMHGYVLDKEHGLVDQPRVTL